MADHEWTDDDLVAAQGAAQESSPPVGRLNQESIIAGMAPVCPYCGCTPAKIQASPLQIGVIQVLVFCCGEPKCRKIYNLNVTAIAQPMVQPARPGQGAPGPGNVLSFR